MVIIISILKTKKRKEKEIASNTTTQILVFFFLSLFFLTLIRGFKAAAPLGGPTATFRSAIHSSWTHVGLSVLR